MIKDFIVEKQLPCWIMKCTKCLSFSLPFYATQKISPFLNSSISANHDKVIRHSANDKIFIIRGVCFSTYIL
jgi:hypothetical protein